VVLRDWTSVQFLGVRTHGNLLRVRWRLMKSDGLGGHYVPSSVRAAVEVGVFKCMCWFELDCIALHHSDFTP
jgi:hypothetical protein